MHQTSLSTQLTKPEARLAVARAPRAAAGAQVTQVCLLYQDKSTNTDADELLQEYGTRQAAQRQYLCFCISKASKLSTWRLQEYGTRHAAQVITATARY